MAKPFETARAELLENIHASIDQLLPRFYESMPEDYFTGVDEKTRVSHLQAIVTTKLSGLAQELTLRSEDGLQYTFINEQSYRGQLGDFLDRLPRDKPLRSAKVYTATDSSLVIDVFDFGELPKFSGSDPFQRNKAEQIVEHAKTMFQGDELDKLEQHLELCSAEYLLNVGASRICKHFEMLEQVRREESTIVDITSVPERKESGVVVMFRKLDPRRMFERLAHHLGVLNVDIRRAHLESFAYSDGPFSLLGFLVTGAGGKPLGENGQQLSQLQDDISRIPYLTDTVLEVFYAQPEWNLTQSEILLALIHLAHQKLLKQDGLNFTRDQLLAVCRRYPVLGLSIAEHFINRFDPNGDSASATDEIGNKIEAGTENFEDGKILETLLAAANAVLKTNLFVSGRHSLALRIDPNFLEAPQREEVPFGVFFVHGREFDGFHLRFRDIARGGVRIVRPRSASDYTLETERLYDEVYGLAYAQQLKNKDIPEGGSKAVVLIKPDGDPHLCGQDFADGLLDLITQDAVTKASVVDHYGKPELLYLGPDENVSPLLIDWIVARAKHRGYPMANTFMSSKPGAGINHKVYGVTSEGVTVFLEHALLAAGINPRKQAFSVKMTGGPDGDVAGNELRILFREFGEYTQVVGMADGSGCAEDPAGLNHDELLRLVKNETPIAAFDRGLLGPQGLVKSIAETDGNMARNSLHNRLRADAFIPAGGRPQTINSENWSEFLLANGEPSSKIIVEGANLFITPEARDALSRCGAIIVKDSSANKCGVICSSLEIMAGMLFSEETFLAVKERFIQEVLVKLRKLAELEVRCLFLERRHKPHVSFPELSTRLSRAIISATDAVADEVSDLAGQNPMLVAELIKCYLPAVLQENAPSNLDECIPGAYLQQIMAATLASRIVYREGMDYFEYMPPSAISRLARQYLDQEQEIAALVQQIADSTLPDRERIAELLTFGGTGTALRMNFATQAPN